MRKRTLELVAGTKTSGEEVRERILAEETLDEGVFRLLVTPGLVLGVAAGDWIRYDDETGEFDIVTRGGNLSVQIYGPPECAESAELAMSKIGGRLDGNIKNLAIYTVPVSIGFKKIEAVMGEIEHKCSSVEWYYGNVYDPADGITPLNWWLEPYPHWP